MELSDESTRRLSDFQSEPLEAQKAKWEVVKLLIKLNNEVNELREQLDQLTNAHAAHMIEDHAER